jgi:hypothetical protein
LAEGLNDDSLTALADFNAGFSEEKMASLYQPFPSDKPSFTTDYDYDSDSDLDDDEFRETQQQQESLPIFEQERSKASSTEIHAHLVCGIKILY